MLPPSAIPLDQALKQRHPGVPVTRMLLLVNLGVFVAMLAAGAGLWHSPNGIQLAWGANFGPATQDGEWWRLGTAMFLHFGVWHLAMNLWALWDSGQFVERMFGSTRFAMLYLASGLGGNLLSLVIQGNRAVSGGASGAILGLYGALLVFLWQERKHVHRGDFRWLFWGAAGFTAVVLTLGLWIPGIDNAAHSGGFVTGVLSGLVLMPASDTANNQPWRRRLIASALLAGAIAWLVAALPQPAYRWNEELAARREIGAFLREEADIGRAWQTIVAQSRRRGATFDEIAGQIDSEITDRYEESFEQLSGLHLDPAAPSAGQLEQLRRHAESRRDASRALADALRTRKAPPRSK
jgi:rhomboid protease GluP